MPELSEQALKTELAKGTLRQVYVFCGAESYTRDFYAEKLAQKAVLPGFESFNLKKIDGTEKELSDILQASEQLPLAGGYNCCVVRDFPLASLHASDAEKLGAYICRVPDTTVLLFCLRDETFPPKAAKDETADQEKKKKRKEMFEQFRKQAAIVRFDRLPDSAILSLLIKGAEKRGSRLSEACARTMVELCGRDLYALLGELEKLCIASDDISEPLIRAVVTKTMEATSFEIIEHLLAGKLDRAIQSLRILLDRKTPSQMILGAMIFPFVDMYRLRTAQKAGRTLRDVMKDFSYSSSFRLEKAQRSMRGLSDEQIRSCLAALGEADAFLKSRGGSDALVLEETLVKLGAVLC